MLVLLVACGAIFGPSAQAWPPWGGSHLGGGASASTLGVGTFVYKPGGTPGGNVYTTAATVCAAANAAGEPATVLVDDSVTSPAPWAVACNVDNWTFRGIINPTTQLPAFLTLQTGAALTFNLLNVQDIEIHSTATSSAISASSAIQDMLLYEAAFVSDVATPIVSVANGGHFTLIVNGGEALGDGTHPIVTVATGGTFNFYGTWNAVLTANTVTGSGASAGASYFYTPDSQPNTSLAGAFNQYAGTSIGAVGTPSTVGTFSIAAQSSHPYVGLFDTTANAEQFICGNYAVGGGSSLFVACWPMVAPGSASTANWGFLWSTQDGYLNAPSAGGVVHMSGGGTVRANMTSSDFSPQSTGGLSLGGTPWGAIQVGAAATYAGSVNVNVPIGAATVDQTGNFAWTRIFEKTSDTSPHVVTMGMGNNQVWTIRLNWTAKTEATPLAHWGSGIVHNTCQTAGSTTSCETSTSEWSNISGGGSPDFAVPVIGAGTSSVSLAYTSNLSAAADWQFVMQANVN